VDFHGISWVLVDWMWSLKALHHIKLHDMTFYIALLYILLNYIAFTWHDMTLHRGTGG
jgi:TorA maturation chaperone TorD